MIGVFQCQRNLVFLSNFNFGHCFCIKKIHRIMIFSTYLAPTDPLLKKVIGEIFTDRIGVTTFKVTWEFFKKSLF